MNHTDSLEQLHLHLQHLADTLICGWMQTQNALESTTGASNKQFLQQRLHLWSRGCKKHFGVQDEEDLHMTDSN